MKASQHNASNHLLCKLADDDIIHSTHDNTVTRLRDVAMKAPANWSHGLQLTTTAYSYLLFPTK